MEDVCVELNEDKKGRDERDEKKHVHGWTVARRIYLYLKRSGKYSNLRHADINSLEAKCGNGC